MDNNFSIPRYFQNKKIFITGGSGFVGKVLIEKLLRSCPDISDIYVLIRPKKNKTAEERIQEIIEKPVFDRLKTEYPENIKKIIPVYGDVTQIGFGLSSISRKLLVENVNIIYHAAASVRFDDHLNDAILINTRGAREMCYLALEMKHLEVLFYISTAYSNTKRKIIGEEMYPPYADWKDAIALAENIDQNTFDILTQKYMDKLPNTYLFTKNLAEHVIFDLCSEKIPVIIFRPSIVIASGTEPLPGWVENFNGPNGLIAAGSKGILRVLYSRRESIIDFVPVDDIVKAIIIATWKKGISKCDSKYLDISVYNGSNNGVNCVNMQKIYELGQKLYWIVPSTGLLWYPELTFTTSDFMYLVLVIFYHVLPAIVVDGLRKVTYQKPMLFKIQRKIYIANMALKYFITQDWIINNDNFMALDRNISPGDKKDFSFNFRDYNQLEYFKNAALGGKKYLLNEDSVDLDKAKLQIKILYILYILFNIIWYFGICYFIIFKLDVIGRLEGYFQNVDFFT